MKLFSVNSSLFIHKKLRPSGLLREGTARRGGTDGWFDPYGEDGIALERSLASTIAEDHRPHWLVQSYSSIGRNTEVRFRKLKQLVTPKPRPTTFDRPFVGTKPNKNESHDLFSWEANEVAAAQIVSEFDLPIDLQEPTRKLLESGVKSARVISELLIENHRAPAARLITEKPKIFVVVCIYIEGLNGIQILSVSSEDRHYSF